MKVIFLSLFLLNLSYVVIAKSRYDVLVKNFEEKAKAKLDKYKEGLTDKQKELLTELVEVDETQPTAKSLEAVGEPTVFKTAVKLSADVLMENKVDKSLVNFIITMLHATANNTIVSSDEDEQLRHELEVIGTITDKYDALSQDNQKLADTIFPDYANTLFHVEILRKFTKEPQKHTVAYLRYKTYYQGYQG